MSDRVVEKSGGSCGADECDRSVFRAGILGSSLCFGDAGGEGPV